MGVFYVGSQGDGGGAVFMGVDIVCLARSLQVSLAGRAEYPSRERDI